MRHIRSKHASRTLVVVECVLRTHTHTHTRHAHAHRKKYPAHANQRNATQRDKQTVTPQWLAEERKAIEPMLRQQEVERLEAAAAKRGAGDADEGDAAAGGGGGRAKGGRGGGRGKGRGRGARGRY